MAMPKSRILTKSSPERMGVMMMLSGLRSRCTSPALCASSTAEST